MRIKVNSWHFRIYVWWLHHTGREQPKKIGLCLYVNTVFWFAPWALLMDQLRKAFTWLGHRLIDGGEAIGRRLPIIPSRTVGFIAWLMVAVVLAIAFFGSLYWVGRLIWVIWQYPIDTLWILLFSAAALGALIVAAGIFAGAFFGVRRILPKGKHERKPRPVSEPMHMPGTIKLFFEWASAKHQKICPWLEFVDPRDNREDS